MSTTSPENTPTPPTPSARPFGVPEATPARAWPPARLLVPELVVPPVVVPVVVPPVVPPTNGGGKTPPGQSKP